MLENSLKKRIIKLHQKKYREKYGEFLIEGIKNITEALKIKTRIKAVIVEERRKNEKEMRKILKQVEQKMIETQYCGRKDIGNIKTTDTFAGVMAIAEMPKHTLEDIEGGAPIILLDRISDPGNLGTIIRTADWFGIKNILLSEDSVDPYNEKAARSTMGSVFHVKIVKSTEIAADIKYLKEKGHIVVSLSMNGEGIGRLKSEPKAIYVFGSESRGIRPELEKLSDKRYTILGKGCAESLNVAVASGILLHQISRTVNYG